MNRPEALGELHRLASGTDSEGRPAGAKLETNLAGQRRLLERIASHDDAEALRDMLVELGARALLDGGPGGAGARR